MLEVESRFRWQQETGGLISLLPQARAANAAKSVQTGQQVETVNS